MTLLRRASDTSGNSTPGDPATGWRPCPHGDPLCPCQDVYGGQRDPCHYERYGDSEPWPCPTPGCKECSMTTPVVPQPGDLVFCHSKGFVGGGIRLIEHLRRDWGKTSEAGGANYNHIAIIDEAIPGTDDWYVIQAEARGVTDDGRLSTLSPGGSYTVVPLPAGVDREKVLAFARAQVGYEYGFITDACILLTLFSPTFVNVMAPHTWICSALAFEALRFGGWLHDWPDIYQVSPAQGWLALEAA